MTPSPKVLFAPPPNKKNILTAKKKLLTPPKEIFCWTPSKKNFYREKKEKNVLVLLSASVERFSVSRMRFLLLLYI